MEDLVKLQSLIKGEEVARDELSQWLGLAGECEDGVCFVGKGPGESAGQVRSSCSLPTPGYS